MSNRNNPHFILFPINNARTGFKPFAMPVLYVEPRRVDSTGNFIDNSETLRLRYKVIDAPSPAKVNGPFNRNIRIPDQSLFEIEIDDINLLNRKLDLRSLIFRDNNGNIKAYEDAVEGDKFEYKISSTIIDNGPTDLVTYYPDAFYYDLADIAIDVSDLPRPKNYYFVWESFYYRRIDTIINELKCITDDVAISHEELLVNHPGDIHEFMFRSTPGFYFDYEGFSTKSDPTLEFYRPLADALQDVFDEQSFLDGINQLNTIPAEYIPYLAYLIGWELPNFPGTTDSLRRSMLKRGTELQKLKSSRRVISELFGMFGFIVDIINLYVDLSGNNYLSPGNGLSTSLVTQTDLVINDYDARGFSLGEVPLVYKPIRDSQVVLYSWIVKNNTSKYDELKAVSDELSDDLEFYNIDSKSYNVDGILEPPFINKVGSNLKEGIIGFSRVVVGESSTSVGRPVLNDNNIEYDDNKNILNVNFDHELSVDNDCKIFVFATYSRNKIVIPDELSNTRTNKFDIEIIDRKGFPVDFNLLLFLLDFLFNLKSFHSLLRKIKVTSNIVDIYNVTDLCIDGSDVYAENTTLGELQVAPAVTPIDTDECIDSEDRGFKDSDLFLRRLILDGLEEEFQAWKSLSPSDCKYTNKGQDKVISDDPIPSVTDTDKKDYDHEDDNRKNLCGPNDSDLDYCYKGRVEDEISNDLIVPNKEYIKCNPCDLNMGSVVYWELDSDVDLDGQNSGELNNLLENRKNDIVLHYSDSPYLTDLVFDFNNTIALNPVNINLDKDNLGFPSHRFISMNRLKNDYNFTSSAVSLGFDRSVVKQRPWDDTNDCGDSDFLNYRIVIGQYGQRLIWDDKDLIYNGNGLDSEIPSLSDHDVTSDDKIITHKIFQSVSYFSDIIEFDMSVMTTDEYIDTSSIETGSIFSSACEQDNTDFIGGYPASIGFQDTDIDTFINGSTNDEYYFCDDVTCSYGYLDRDALANFIGLPIRDNTDVGLAKYFGSSMEYITPNHVEYIYYVPYRLDCSCLDNFCSGTNVTDDYNFSCNSVFLFDKNGNLDVNCDKIDNDLAISLKESMNLCSRTSNGELPNLFCLNKQCKIPDEGSFRYKDDYDVIYEVEWIISEDTMDITVVTKDNKIPGMQKDGYTERVSGGIKVFNKGIITTIRQIIKIYDNISIIEAEGVESKIGYFQVNITCGQDQFDNPFYYFVNCSMKDSVKMLVTDGPHWVDPLNDVGGSYWADPLNPSSNDTYWV